MNASPSLDWWRPEAVPLLEAPDEDRDADREGGRLAFVALLAFTFVLVIAPQEFMPALAPLRPALLAAVVAVAAQLSNSARRTGGTGPSRELVIAAALLGWAVATIPFSMWPGGSVALLFNL